MRRDDGVCVRRTLFAYAELRREVNQMKLFISLAVIAGSFDQARHSGALAPLRERTRNPEPLSDLWIPGSRQEARPGMTG